MQSENLEILFHSKSSALNVSSLNIIRSSRRNEIQKLKIRISFISRANLHNFVHQRRNAIVGKSKINTADDSFN